MKQQQWGMHCHLHAHGEWVEPHDHGSTHSPCACKKPIEETLWPYYADFDPTHTDVIDVGEITALQDSGRPQSDGKVFSVEDKPTTSEIETHLSNPSSLGKTVCGQCLRTFKTQNDANRHKASVHDKTTPYFCHEMGCRRVKKGFSRKDNFEVHLSNVHGIKSSSILNHAVVLDSPDTTQDSEPKRTRHHHMGLRSLSRGQLIELVSKEREKCDTERRKRQELEAQISKMRDWYEEREAMFLKLLGKS